jgi:hypothetical protein
MVCWSVRNGGLGTADLGAFECSEVGHLSVCLVVRFHIPTGALFSGQAPSPTALVSGESPLHFQGVLTESVGFFVGSSGQRSAVKRCIGSDYIVAGGLETG